MGEIYHAICRKCGKETEYHIGGGFCTTEYHKETERLRKQIKEDIIWGKYGEMLKSTFENCNGNLGIYCDEQIFQCYKCKKICVTRENRISNFPYLKDNFKIEIDFFVPCPECGNKKMDKSPSFTHLLWCEKCKSPSLEMTQIGDWD